MPIFQIYHKIFLQVLEGKALTRTPPFLFFRLYLNSSYSLGLLIVMEKTSFFWILAVTSIVSLITLFLIMVYSFPSSSTQPDWMTGMWSHMGGMMGGNMQTSDSYLGYFGLLFVALIGVLVVGIGGLVYFLLFPELKSTTPQKQKRIPQLLEKSTALDSIRKTLTVDERKILEVLQNHKGIYLQKYIRKEAGLSRLKTHRIIARFTKRDMVTLKKVGNTNEVKLSDWLTKGNPVSN